jgi:hypothetical protein
VQRREYAKGLVAHCLCLIRHETEGKGSNSERTLRYLSFLSSLESGVPLGPTCCKTSVLALAIISGCYVKAQMVNAINAAVCDFFQTPNAYYRSTHDVPGCN